MCPNLGQIEISITALKLDIELDKSAPKSAPRFQEPLSPYCHGPPKVLINPRDRRILDSPSDEQKDLLKDRSKYEHCLESMSVNKAPLLKK